jgi:hypothetical protein
MWTTIFIIVGSLLLVAFLVCWALWIKYGDSFVDDSYDY